MNIYLLCIISTIVISALCGFIFIPIILHYCNAHHLYDLPNIRKVHRNAVPRLGGISFIPSMFIAFVIALCLVNTNSSLITINLWTLNFLVSILLIYGMGIVDDVFELAPSTKFIVQIIAACILPASGLYINNLYGFLGIHLVPYVIGFPLTVLLVVFITNAMNLIDGIDGLAASLSIIALLGFIYVFYRQGVWAYAILIAGLVGVLISFLYFNLFGSMEKNRKIFMGDSGSLTIGYILGFLCIKYTVDNPLVMSERMFHFFMTFTLILIPLFDVVRVFCERLVAGRSPFSADKSHIHHKLMRAGLSQHQTLIVILVWQILYILLNHVILKLFSSTVVFIIDIVIYAIGCLIIDLCIRKNRSSQETLLNV